MYSTYPINVVIVVVDIVVDIYHQGQDCHDETAGIN